MSEHMSERMSKDMSERMLDMLERMKIWRQNVKYLFLNVSCRLVWQPCHVGACGGMSCNNLRCVQPVGKGVGYVALYLCGMVYEAPHKKNEH